MPRGALLLIACLCVCGLAMGQPSSTGRYDDSLVSPTVNLFNDGKVRLVFRADDAGFTHSANVALEKILEARNVSAISVMVTTGWLDEAVEILAKHPEVSVGVHVTLNSEWVPYKWGPVLPAKEVPTLVDEWGHFFGTRKELMARQPNLDEVEREIRAQVELARRKGLKLSYMDHHMSAAVGTPEMRDRFKKVADEYGLGISRWFGEQQGPIVYNVEPEKKTEFLLGEIEKITTPGIYLVVCHTLQRSPEVEVLKDLNPNGPVNMVDHRQAETHMLCDPRLKDMLQRRNIEIIGYDVLQSRFRDQMKPAP